MAQKGEVEIKTDGVEQTTPLQPEIIKEFGLQDGATIADLNAAFAAVEKDAQSEIGELELFKSAILGMLQLEEGLSDDDILAKLKVVIAGSWDAEKAKQELEDEKSKNVDLTAQLKAAQDAPVQELRDDLNKHIRLVADLNAENTLLKKQIEFRHSDLDIISADDEARVKCLKQFDKDLKAYFKQEDSADNVAIVSDGNIFTRPDNAKHYASSKQMSVYLVSKKEYASK